MAERGKLWTAAETKLLIDTWSRDSILKQLHGAKQNDNVFAQIVNTLAKRGYHTTAQQCRAKTKTLTRLHASLLAPRTEQPNVFCWPLIVLFSSWNVCSSAF